MPSDATERPGPEGPADVLSCEELLRPDDFLRLLPQMRPGIVWLVPI